MNRPLDHLLAYTLSELGTTGTFDGNKRLVVRGRFNTRQLENVQKNYIGRCCRVGLGHVNIFIYFRSF